jgi:hypothetical protein
MEKENESLFCIIFVQICIFICFFLHFVADYETLRALEFGTASNTSSMTDEEINALPIHKYKVPGPTK